MINEITGNIVNQLGGGSGIDTRSLVDQLVELERAPTENRLDRREERLEAQISDLGQLRSTIDDLQAAVEPLANKDVFNAKSVAVPDTNLLAINQIQPDAVAGDFRLRVDQVAQSQSLSSAGFQSLDASVGEGSLTLRLGSFSADLASFTPDPDAQGATIEIDQSNNSLTGLRDAINNAGIGVQASIVGEEGNFQLLVTGPTGATNEVEITATEDPVQPGLAAFNFNETTQNLTQLQEGLDAIVQVNGLQVTRSSNNLTDVIQGVDIDLFNADPTEIINISISDDKSVAEQSIRDFVEAFNNFVEKAEELTSFNREDGTEGSLRNDPTVRNLLSSVRGALSGAVPGIEGDFNVLASVGIRTNRDGTLQIVEDGNTGFRNAIDNNFDKVRELFVPTLGSSSAKIEPTGFSSRTQPGSYQVEITQEAAKGVFNADPVTAAFPLDTTGRDFSFELQVDGNTSALIAIPEGRVFASGAELADELQSLINLDAAIKDGNAKVNVSFDAGTNSLSFQSNRLGAASQVNFVSASADMANLGVTAGTGTPGVDVVGTIDGEEGFGLGNVLLPPLGSPAEGLSMTIKPGASSGEISFSRGFGARLTNLLDSFTRNSGFIDRRENNIDRDLRDIEDQRSDLDRRIESFRARQEAQFRAMEQIVRSLNNTGDFLDGIENRLPFTAQNN